MCRRMNSCWLFKERRCYNYLAGRCGDERNICDREVEDWLAARRLWRVG